MNKFTLAVSESGIPTNEEVGTMPMMKNAGEELPSVPGSLQSGVRTRFFDIATAQAADRENESAFAGMPTEDIRKRLEYARLEARARMMADAPERFGEDEFGAIFKELNDRRFIADAKTIAAFDAMDGAGKVTNLSRLKDFLAFSDKLSAAKTLEEQQTALDDKFASPELKAWREALALDAPNGFKSGANGTKFNPDGTPISTENRAKIAREYFDKNGRSWGDKVASLRGWVGNPNDWIEGTTDEWFSDSRAISEYEKVLQNDVLRAEAAKVMPYLSESQKNLVNLAASGADMKPLRGVFYAMKPQDREMMYSMCQAVRPVWDGNWLEEMGVRAGMGVRSAWRAMNRADVSLTASLGKVLGFNSEADMESLRKSMIDDIHWAESVSDLKLKDPDGFLKKALEGYADSASMQYSMLGGEMLKRAGATKPGYIGGAMTAGGWVLEGYTAASMIGEQFDNMLLRGIPLERAAPLAVAFGLGDTWVETWNLGAWTGANLTPAQMKRVGIRAAFRSALKMDGKEFVKVLGSNAKQALVILGSELGEETVQALNKEAGISVAEGRNIVDAFTSSAAYKAGMDGLWEALPSCTAFGVFGAANPTGTIAKSANGAYADHLQRISSAVARRNGMESVSEAQFNVAQTMAANEAARVVRSTAGMSAKERNAWINAQTEFTPAEKQFYVEHCEMYAASVAQDGKAWADAHLTGSINEAMFAKAGWKFSHDESGNITSVTTTNGEVIPVNFINREARAEDYEKGGVENFIEEYNRFIDEKKIEGEKLTGKDDPNLAKAIAENTKGWYKNGKVTLFGAQASGEHFAHETTHAMIERLSELGTKEAREAVKALANEYGQAKGKMSLEGEEKLAYEQQDKASAYELANRMIAPDEVSLKNIGKNIVTAVKKIFGQGKGEAFLPVVRTAEGIEYNPEEFLHDAVVRSLAAYQRKKELEAAKAKERKEAGEKFKAEREAKRQKKIEMRKVEAAQRAEEARAREDALKAEAESALRAKQDELAKSAMEVKERNRVESEFRKMWEERLAVARDQRKAAEAVANYEQWKNDEAHKEEVRAAQEKLMNDVLAEIAKEEQSALDAIDAKYEAEFKALQEEEAKTEAIRKAEEERQAKMEAQMLANRKNASKDIPRLGHAKNQDGETAQRCRAAYIGAWKAKMGRAVSQDEVNQLAENYGLPPEALNLKKTGNGYRLSKEQLLSDESLTKFADGILKFYADLSSVKIIVPDVVVATADDAVNAVPNEVYDPVSDTFIQGRVVIDAANAKSLREQAGMTEPSVSPEEIEKARENHPTRFSLISKNTAKSWMPNTKVIDADGFPKVVYHGTTKYGFTKFDPLVSDDGISLFFTDSISTAKTYSGVSGVREIGDKDYQGDILEEAEKRINEVANDIYSKANKLYPYSFDFQDLSDMLKRYANDVADGKMTTDTAYIKVYEDLTDNIAHAWEPSAEYEEFADWQENSSEFGELADLFEEATAAVMSYRDAVVHPENSGNYQLYLNIENPLVIDAKGSNWNGIDASNIGGVEGAKTKTRVIAKYAKEHGYDGVIIENLIDNGGNGIPNAEPTNIYIAFNSNQVKSADGTTYDDEGNAIPLEKRGNLNNTDIRFSLLGGEDYVRKFGYVLSGDSVRTTLPGYDPKDYKTHIDKTGYVGGVMQKTFEHLLATRKNQGDGTVVFLAGGNGAGKSTIAKKTEMADFVVDSTLGNLEVAKAQIDAVLANGQTPHIMFVYRSPEEALGGIEKRVNDGGHIVSPVSFANSHTKSLENLSLISRAYNDKIRINVFHNSNAKGLTDYSLEELEAQPKADYERIRKQANEAVDRLRSQGALRGGESGNLGSREKVKFSIANAEWDKLEKHFGVTANGLEAGYIIPNGHMLDFSGAHWTANRKAPNPGHRQVDHADVKEAIKRDFDSNWLYRWEMMEAGAIRVMPEMPSLGIARDITPEQEDAIYDWLEWVRGKSYGPTIEFFKGVNGQTETIDFPAKVSARAVINAIHAHYGAEQMLEGLPSEGTDAAGRTKFSLATYRNGGRDTLVKWMFGEVGTKLLAMSDKELMAYIKLADEYKWMKGAGKTAFRKKLHPEFVPVDEKSAVGKGQLTIADAVSIVRETDKVCEVATELAKTGKFKHFSNWSEVIVETDNEGNPIFGVVRPNGDYAYNLDFSTICKKRRPLDHIFASLVEDGTITDANINILLSEENIPQIQDIIKKHVLEVACALCFVDSKRYKIGEVAKNFSTMWNGIQDMYAEKGTAWKKALAEAHKKRDGKMLVKDEETGEMKEAKPTFYDRAVMLVDEEETARTKVDASWLISGEGMDEFARKYTAIHNLYRSFGGVSKAKDAHADVAWNNDIIRPFAHYTNPKSSMSSLTREKAYAVGGVRLQSFTDFIPALFFDYAQMTAELAAKRLPLHTYTKEVDFVKLFGLTGMKMNMSLVPGGTGVLWMTEAEGAKQGLFAIHGKDNKPVKKNGKVAFYDLVDECFPIKEAFELRKGSSNVGTIMVGVSDEHIALMLDDPRIDMVIPYHKSSLNGVVAAMRKIDKYDDYTDYQSTKKPKDAKDFDFYGDLAKTKDPRTTAANYLAFCKKHGYTAKFTNSRDGNDFSKHPNYYKLLADFRLYKDDGKTYAPQGDVTQTYPKNLATLLKDAMEHDQRDMDALDRETEPIKNEVRAAVFKMGSKFAKAKSVAKETRPSKNTTNFSIGNRSAENVAKFFLAREIIENNGRLPDTRRAMAVAKGIGYSGSIENLLNAAAAEADVQTKVLRYLASDPKTEKIIARAGLALRNERAIERARSAAIQFSREVSEAREGSRKAMERAVRTTRGEDYEMMLAREGLDLNAILLAIRPEERKDAAEPGEKTEQPKPVTLDAAGRELVADLAKKAVENGAKLVAEARAAVAAKKDDDGKKNDGKGKTDDGAADPYGDIAYGNAISAAFHEAIAKSGLTLESPEAMVQLVKAITEKYIRDYSNEFNGVDLNDIWESPLARAKFAANLASFANAVASAYAPSYSRVRISQKAQLLNDQGLTSMRMIEQVGEELFRDLHGDVIRQSRESLIKDIKKVLKPQAKHYSENELKQDRKGVDSALGRYCKIANKCIDMTAKEVEERAKELEDELATWAGVAEDEAERYREFADKKMELEMLDMFGNLKSRMPAELKALRDFVEQTINESRWEIMQFGEKWEASRVAGADAMMGAIQGNPKDNGVMPEDDDISGLYSLIGMMETKAHQLTRFCKDGAVRAKSLQAFSMVEEMIQAAEDKQYNFVQMQKAKFVDICKSVYGSEEAAADALSADIDKSLWSQLDKGEQKTAWTIGRVMQMYVSCVQADYADNCAKYGRDAAYVQMLENILNTMNPKHLDFIAKMREMYMEQGDALSEVLEKTTGTKLLTPNRLYMPVKMLRDNNIAQKGRARAYNPFAPSLTPRVKNGLDFDQTIDIVDMWQSRLDDTAHTIAWADTGSMVQGICLSDRVLKAIRQSHGDKVMRQWNRYILDILAGAETGKIDNSNWGVKTMRFCARLASRTWLMLNPASWSKQLAAVPCFALSADGNLKDVAKSVSFCALHPFQAAKVIHDLSQTDAFKARYGVAISQEMKYATSDKGRFSTWIDKLVDIGMAGVMKFDMFGVYALAGVYHSKRCELETQGKSAAEASEIASSWLMHIVDKTAQTTRSVNTTELQRAGGAWGILLQFKSAPAQQTQFEITAIQDALANPNDTARWKKAGVCILINHLIVPTINTAIESVLTCLTGWGIPDDEKRQRLIEMWIANIISGSLGSVVFIGTIIEAFGNLVSKVAVGEKPNMYDLRNSVGRQIPAAEMVNLWLNQGDKAIRAFCDITEGDIQEGCYDLVKAITAVVPGLSWASRKGFKAYESATEQ